MTTAKPLSPQLPLYDRHHYERVRLAAIPKILDTAIEKAVAGDVKCMQLVADPDLVTQGYFDYDLGEIWTAHDAKIALQKVLRGLATGQLRQSQAAALQQAIAGILEAIHMVDHEVHLQELEGRIGIEANPYSNS